MKAEVDMDSADKGKATRGDAAKKESVNRKQIKQIRIIQAAATVLNYILTALMAAMAAQPATVLDASNNGGFNRSITLVATAVGGFITAFWATYDTYQTWRGSEPNAPLPTWEWHNTRFMRILQGVFALSFFLMPCIVIFILHSVNLSFWTVLFQFPPKFVGIVVFFIIVYFFAFFMDIGGLAFIAYSLKQDEVEEQHKIGEITSLEMVILVSPPPPPPPETEADGPSTSKDTSIDVQAFCKELAVLLKQAPERVVARKPAQKIPEGFSVAVEISGLTDESEEKLRQMVRELVKTDAFVLPSFAVESLNIGMVDNAPMDAVANSGDESDSEKTPPAPKSLKRMGMLKMGLDVLLIAAFIAAAVESKGNSGCVISLIAHCICTGIGFYFFREIMQKKTPDLEAWLLTIRNVFTLHLFIGYVCFWLSLGILLLISQGYDSFWFTLGSLNPSKLRVMGTFAIGLFVIQYFMYAAILWRHNRCMSALDEIASLFLMEKLGDPDAGEEAEEAEMKVETVSELAEYGVAISVKEKVNEPEQAKEKEKEKEKDDGEHSS